MFARARGYNKRYFEFVFTYYIIIVAVVVVLKKYCIIVGIAGSVPTRQKYVYCLMHLVKNDT